MNRLTNAITLAFVHEIHRRYPYLGNFPPVVHKCVAPSLQEISCANTRVFLMREMAAYLSIVSVNNLFTRLYRAGTDYDARDARFCTLARNVAKHNPIQFSKPSRHYACAALHDHTIDLACWPHTPPSFVKVPDVRHECRQEAICLLTETRGSPAPFRQKENHPRRLGAVV